MLKKYYSDLTILGYTLHSPPVTSFLKDPLLKTSYLKPVKLLLKKLNTAQMKTFAKGRSWLPP